jgi:NADPH:quinone reductase-like Zn-dependent oxidoreductase
VVEALGPGASKFQLGDRVATYPGARLQDYGVYAEHAVVPERFATRYADNLSPTQAASVWVAYLTGYFALFEQHRLKPGEFVLITAASSSTGIAAAQWVKWAGAIPIGTTRGRAKVGQLNQLGIDCVVVTAEDDLPAKVAEFTGGRGADVVYDCIGGALLEPLMNAAAVGGDYFLYGLMDPTPTPFPVWAAFARNFDCYMIYSYVGNQSLALPDRPEAVARGLRMINRGCAGGQLQPRIGKTFKGLESIPDALRFMQSGRQIGKIAVEL